MRKFSLYLVTLAVLVGAGVAYSAASPSAKLEKQDRLWGGGQFGPGCFSESVCFELARNIAVDVHAEGDGSRAAGNTTYGAPGGAGGGIDRTVTCLNVEGNKAVMGGTTANGSQWWVQYFVDRGGPAQGDRDLVSPSWTDFAPASSFPAGFPAVCPPASGTPDLPAIYLELDEGDLVVQDAPSN